ncbi:MAG: hypothetical protein AAF329_02000 [Cyanobacteria bacterium P01_A01_bin.17]
MAFKKKSASTVTATATAEKPATSQKFNLKAALDVLANQLSSVATETIEIADSDLLGMPEFGQPGINALKECAKLIGFKDYDPAKSSTFKFVVTKEGSKFLAGPQLMAYGDSCGIVWGEQVIALAEDTSFYSDTYQLMPGSKDNKVTTLLVDPAGYCLPLECRIDSVYRQDDLFFSTKLITARSAEILSQYLRRGEPVIAWKDIEDGPIGFYAISPVTDDEGNVRFAFILAEYKEQPIQVFAPGEYEEWAGVSFSEPIEAVKEDRTVKAAGREFELKGTFTKLRELPEGGVYKVLSYKATQHVWEGKTIHDFQVSAEDAEGNPITIVSVNAFIKDKLGRNPEISEEKPATLHIDHVSETKRGVRVSCRLVTTADESNPFLKKIQAQQAAAKATSEPENYDSNPL